MAGLKWIFGIILIIGFIGFLIYYDGFGTPQIAVPLVNFITETTKFGDGSYITTMVPDQPVGENSKPVTTKVLVNDNGTETVVEVVPENITAPVKNVAQFSKSDPNGVVVQGYILLVSASSGLPIQPYVYNAMILIECDDELNDKDGFSFCSTKDIVGRVTTEDGGRDEDGEDRGGFYQYKWHPKFGDDLAFYDVTVLVTSDQKNSFGQYENYEKSYKIQVLQ